MDMSALFRVDGMVAVITGGGTGMLFKPSRLDMNTNSREQESDS